MSDLLSGQISFSGLGSGTDFNSIVSQLMVVESIPLNRLKGKRDTYDARKEAVDSILKVMEEAQEKIKKLSSRENFVKKEATVAKDSVATAKANGDAADASYVLEVTQVAEYSTAVGSGGTFTSKTDTLGKDGIFAYSIGGGDDILIPVRADMTLEQLAKVINDDPDNPGVRMVLNGEGPNFSFGFKSTKTGKDQEILVDTHATTSGDIFGTMVFDSTQTGADAIYKVDGYELHSASNDITIADGLEASIFGIGTTNVVVKTDKEAVKENIQEFLDAVNSVIKEIDNYTNINSEDKEVRKKDEASDLNDPNEDAMSTYLKDLVSTKAVAKGNILTGESSVKTFDSRISNMLTSLGLGFSRKQSEDDVGGDLIATFAEMGIKVNSVQGDPNFGMFEIAPSSGRTNSEGKEETGVQDGDQDRFDDYIENHIDDVVDFFVADNKIETSSTGFFYVSHIESALEPGAYDVTYSVVQDPSDPTKTLIENVFINGEPASEDNGLYSVGFAAGGAAGLSIRISDTVINDYNETIKVQQGKINEVANMFNTELRPYTDFDISSENGALAVLRNGYKDTMKSLDDQLWREEARLGRWETRKKLEFARLETLLSRYNNSSQSMSAQLGGLMKTY